MKKLDLNEHWLEILIAVSGALMLAVLFLADSIGLRGQAGFGLKQIITGRLIWIRQVRIVWRAYHSNNPAQDRQIAQS